MSDEIQLVVVGKMTNLKPMISTVSRIERELVRATKAVDQNKISQERYNKILQSSRQQYKALGVSASVARREVNGMAASLKNTMAEEKAAQATRTLAREKDALARKYKPLYAATQLYEKGLREIKRATDLKILSDEEAIKSTMRLKAAFNTATTGMSRGISQAGRSTNQLGVVAQQTGYQVGDFLVQIQSGANPMMAFGQQATQLVGVLPLLSDQLGVSAGKLMGIAAGLGIAIPLVTAIAGYFIRSGGGAKSFSDKMSDLTEATSAYTSAADLAGNSTEELEEKFGSASKRAGQLADFISNLARVEAIEAINKSVEELSETFGGFSRSDMVSTTDGLMREIVETAYNIKDQFNLINDEANILTVGLEGISKAAGLEEQQQAAIDFQKALIKVFGSAEQIPAELREIAAQAAEIALQAAEVEGATNGSAAAIALFSQYSERDLGIQEERSTAVDAIKESVDSAVNSMQDELELAASILRYGEDSVQTQALIAKQAREQVVANLKNDDILGNNLKTVMAIYDQIFNAEAQTNSWASAMAGVAAQIQGIMNALASIGGGLIENVSLRIQSEVLESGGSLRDAAVANERYLHDIEMANLSAAAALEGTAAAIVANTVTIPALNKVFEDNITETDRLAAATDNYREGLKETTTATKAGGSAADDAAKELEKLRKEIEQLEWDANPLLAYNDALANLNKLLAMEDGISIDAYTKAVNDLNKGLVETDPLISGVSDAFSDFMGRGFKDFKQFVSDILTSFKNLLVEMAMTALRNKIIIPMMTKMEDGGTGGIMSGIGASMGGGGVSAMTGLSAAGAGFGASASALMAGGPSMMMASISGQVAAATAVGASPAAAMAAIGAVAAPLLAVAAVFMAFKKKTKILENGLRVSVDGLGTTVEKYEKIRKSNLFSSSTNDKFTASDAEIADPITSAVRELQQGVADAALSLGVGAEVFKGFSRSFTLSLKDLSAEEAQALLQAELMNTQNAFAVMIPTLTDWSREGEAATTTLNRLIVSLSATNDVFSTLGFTLFEATLAGAGAASIFADIFGGIDNMLQVTSGYFSDFYSAGEQLANMDRILNKAFSDLGVDAPTTKVGFRDTVDNAAASGNTKLVAELIGLSAAFSEMIALQADIAQAAADAAQAAADAAQAAKDNLSDFLSDYDSKTSDNLAAATSDLEASFAFEMNKTRESFEASIAILEESLTGAKEKLANSKAIADALSNAMSSRVFPAIEDQRQSQDEAAAYLRSLMGTSEITDVDALKEALDIVATPSTDTYETLLQYRRDFMRTSFVIASLNKTAAMTLSADEQAVLLLETQIEDMRAQFDIEMGMLQSQLDALLGIGAGVKSLADAISAFNTAKGAAGGSTGGGGAVTDYAKSLNNNGFSDGFSREQWYLANNTDVLAAVAKGQFSSGLEHFQQFGQFEDRPSFAGGGSTGNGARAGGLDGMGGFMAMLHPQEDVIDRTRPAPRTSNDNNSSNDTFELRREVNELRSEQRQILMDISKHTKRSYDLERKHDVEGTPPVRAA